MAFVYILRSLKNGRFYVGSTDNLERRLSEHNKGFSGYTKFTRPFEIVFSQKFKNLSLARKAEYRLKSYKNRQILDRIIADGKIKAQNDKRRSVSNSQQIPQ